MTSPTPDLTAALGAAIERRQALLARLTSEGTDCVRLLHGVVEGAPGVTIDRYGPILLVQTWREPLAEGGLDALDTARAKRSRSTRSAPRSRRAGTIAATVPAARRATMPPSWPRSATSSASPTTYGRAIAARIRCSSSISAPGAGG